MATITTDYTTQAIANYNASPPPDDGTTSSANEITWAKHKTKLSDPVKTLAEATNTELVTTFAQVVTDLAVVTNQYRSTEFTGFSDASFTPNARNHLSASGSGAVQTRYTNVTTGEAGSVGTVVGIDSAEAALIFNYQNTNLYFGTNGTTRLLIAADGGIITTNATGGSQGADTINASGYYVGGVSVLSDAAAVSGYTSGTVVHIEGDVGAAATTFNIASVIGAAWESVGPTGSGATNIWTALDDIPSSATYAILKIHTKISGASTATLYTASVYARITGSSTGATVQSLITTATLTNRSASAETDSNLSTVYVPINSSAVFDLYFFTGGTAPTGNAECWLVGWGK